MTKRFLLIFILLGMAVLSFGQDMSVKSFYLAETDLTANTPGTIVYDQNGNVCALIKVETTLKGFTFDVGVLGVSSIVEQPAEIWVYVPFGIRKITLQHQHLGVIRDFPLPCTIDKGRTYILKLNASMGNRMYDSSKKQKMILQVSPAGAKVEINGMPVSLDRNGIYEQEVSFGVYDVIISASKYHSERRQIEINDPAKAQRFNINLKQAFGWLQISGSRDEKLSIDGRPMTFVPNKRIELMSGHYKVLLEKPLHQPYERTIEIKDSVVCEIEPRFVVNYRELEFKVYNDAEIWVDDVKVGKGSWKGKLEYGTHRIECRKESHRTTEMMLNVDPQTLGPIVLESPEPIYGSLVVTSNPSGASLYINDKYIGVTPQYISSQLIGVYSISTKSNNEHHSKIVKINDQECLSLDFDFKCDKTSAISQFSGLNVNKKQFVQLIVYPENAVIEVCGELKETRNGVYEELLPIGKYQYKIYHEDYHESQGIIDLSGNTNICSYNVKLKPAFGYLSITENAQEDIVGAKVFVDNTYCGTVPLSALQLNSGIHNITILKDRHRTHIEEVSISDEEIIILNPKLMPICGSLKVVTKPTNAKVFIDDQPVGRAPKDVKNLIIGKHSIKVSIDGYYSLSKEINIKEKRDTTISFSLRKKPMTHSEYNQAYRNRGVINTIEFNYSLPIKASQIAYKNLGIRNYKCLHPVEFTYSIGYRFNYWMSVSAGAGITHELVDLRNRGDEFADYYYENNIGEIVNYSTNIVPIFANSKFYLSRSKYQPMISISTGAYVVPKVKGLLLCDLGFGINYRATKNINCFAMLSFGTAPILSGNVDVYSNKLISTRAIAWTPRFRIGLTL